MKQRLELPPALAFAFAAFAPIDDPRIERTKRHPLINVLLMALCGAIAGANGWDDLSTFARGHLAWFAMWLDVRQGAPSADTFRRVFEVLDPRELEGALQTWIAKVSESFADEVVAIDGKSLKAATEKAGSTTPLHLLHAWAVQQHLLLGQQRVEGAPGEVAAIPELLKRLRIEGAVVTTDANGCTKAVACAVREAKADYVLTLKGNRGPLHATVKKLFAAAESRGFRGIPVYRSKAKGHGRSEQRTVRALVLPDKSVTADWSGLKSVVMIDRTRKTRGETKTERHYYITSLEPDAERLGRTIRAHWGIENNLHWVLDVAFDEDSRGIRDKCSAENFALLSRIALMLLKRSPDRLSIRLKRKRAGWEPEYMSRLLASGMHADVSR